MHNTQLLHLLQLADPTLPIGGFSHSAGLETYVQLAIVHDVATAKTFIQNMLTHNLQYTDAAFASLAYDAAEQRDLKKLIELDNECTAVKLPKEIRGASIKLGGRLLKIFNVLCADGMLLNYKVAISSGAACGHHALAYGVLAFALGIPKEGALAAFYYNAAAGMVTNCVKLIPLGQQHGQEILFQLHPLVTSLATQTLVPDPDLVGLCCTGFDIRCMQHEDLYSRLYMS